MARRDVFGQLPRGYVGCILISTVQDQVKYVSSLKIYKADPTNQ